LQAWAVADTIDGWTLVGIDASLPVSRVSRGLIKSNELVLPTNTKVAQLALYALVDADGKLIKDEPAGMAKVMEQLLEANKPLADQLDVTAPDVAGGYFVVKVAKLPVLAEDPGMSHSRVLRLL
jgi:hypothetical protein